MLHLAYPVANLRPAAYNPRAISPTALEDLQKSISEIGFCKPVIVTQGGTIVAGHQRTKASKALGVDTVPAWVLDAVTDGDEIRFNQLHNGTDLDRIDTAVGIEPVDPASVVPGAFVDVPWTEIMGDLNSLGAPVRNEIANLIMSHGPWGCAVATYDGEIVSSPQYALACRLLRVPCRTYRIPNDKADVARGWFGKAYGEYSYDHLKKQTYLQSFAQLKRLRGDAENGKSNKTSSLYQGLVEPMLVPGERMLDFGCGQADHLKRLRKLGHKAFGVEFFFRKKNDLDTVGAHRMIDETLLELRTNGRFDVVVLDSVLNSVDSLQAEADVLTCISALCKPGGRVYVGTRPRESADSRERSTSAALKKKKREVEFFDKHGFTAIFRYGGWFYQRFLYREEFLDLMRKYLGEPMYKGGSSHNMVATRTVELPQADIEASLRREFDLIWPDGATVGRADAAIDAYRAALALEAKSSTGERSG